MANTIKIGGIEISAFKVGNANCRIYLADTLLYPHVQEPCFAVVDDITQYSDRTYVDVFNEADGLWYKLNNLNQYEEYGIYGDSIETSGSSRLPQGYTEVEYVESTGQSTVNLGIQLMATANVPYSIVLDNEMSYTSSYGDLQTFLTCCQEVPTVYPGWYYRYNSSTNIVIAGSDGINLSTGRTLVSGSTYHVTITGKTNSNRTHDYPLNLFSSLDSNKSPWRFCKGKLYNMQVTYNNNLVRDLVPCKNSSNVAGLYDLVNDVFYTSESGYDTLVAGSEVTPDTATYYQGKLAIVDGYEYMYSGSSWVNVGEVSGSTYPVYYDVIQDPPNNLVFSSMAEAESYECPWVGMKATIDGDNYIFSGDSQSGYEWVYTPTPIDYSTHYLTLVAQTNNVSFLYSTASSNNKLQYSLDSGSTWSELGNNQSTTSVNSGQKVMFKASGLTVNGERGIGTLRPSASASVEGNIMSLEYGDNFSGETTIQNNFQFRKLFSGATNITSAENMVLPATTIKKQCYSQMFQGCTSLTTAPTVIGSSAMTWTNGDDGYYWSDMFNTCTSLVNPPQLPALNLGAQCYWYMFQGCTALTTAPELPAPTLNTQSYRGIFKGCSRLNYIKVLTTSGFSMREWVSGVASSGTFVKKSSASFGNCGQNTVPCNWTVQNI